MPDEPSLFPDYDRDPHPAGAQRFVGRTVRFDYAAAGGATRELTGRVENAAYVGRTKRGAIPDYILVIRGKSGRAVEVSLVESHATFPDPA